MANTNRAEAIENAADACRENADATAFEANRKAWASMDFNTRLFATDTERKAQAAYFADEYGVTTQEVLVALNLA